MLKVAIDAHAAQLKQLGVTQDDESAKAMKGLNAFLLGDVEGGKLPDPAPYVAPDFGSATGRELLGKVLERARQVDWVGISEGLDQKGREEVARFRAIVSEMEKEMSKVHANYTVKINWEEWKNKIDPALVSRMESLVNGLKMPSFEQLRSGASSQLGSLDAQLADINKTATAALADVEKRYAELSAEREGLRALARQAVLGITTEQELAANPLMAKAVEEARDNHQWNAPSSWAAAEAAAKAFGKVKSNPQ